MPVPVASLVCSKLTVVIALYLVVYIFLCITVICLAGAYLQVHHFKQHFLDYFPITFESQQGYEKY